MTTLIAETIKHTFSGHDSFQCRQLWLKKGVISATKDILSFVEKCTEYEHIASLDKNL